jgi:transcriptional antiterminator NusG
VTAKNETQEVVTETTETPAAEKKPAKKGKRTRWYVVQSQSNYEKRVQTAIREQALMTGLDKMIEEVLIPMEEVVEVKKGAKVKSERKFFPGYVLVKAVMTDEVWHLIKGTSHVTGFVGAERGSKPLPISNTEAERILQQMEDGVDKPRSLVSFDVGEEVRVIDGPFSSFQGVVEEIDEEKAKLKVSVSIFGRATPIELEFTQVEKI